MTQNQSTINPDELSKFAQHAKQWWDKQGALKTLHDINPLRTQFITEQLDITDLNLLDVGCGGGILAEELAKNGAFVTGIDAETAAVQAAIEHAAASNLNINYQCTPIELFKGQPFDVITCMELLEHVSDPAMVIAHCARLLKPGGFLFLSTLSRTLKAYVQAILAAEYVLNLLPRQTHDYQKFIKPAELIKMSRVHGFNLINMSGMTYNPVLRTAVFSTNVQINYMVAFQKRLI